MATSDRMEVAVEDPHDELKSGLVLRAEDVLEAQRLEQRTMYDLELAAGDEFAPGSKLFASSDRQYAGQAPPRLLTTTGKFVVLYRRKPRHIPRIGGMYRGDRSAQTC